MRSFLLIALSLVLAVVLYRHFSKSIHAAVDLPPGSTVVLFGYPFSEHNCDPAEAEQWLDYLHKGGTVIKNDVKRVIDGGIIVTAPDGTKTALDLFNHNVVQTPDRMLQMTAPRSAAPGARPLTAK